MAQQLRADEQAGPGSQRSVSMPNVLANSNAHQRRYNGSSSPVTCFDRRRPPPLMTVGNTESWIEVASQPSSSSLSSIGDEIVTTGLRVRGSDSRDNRRRRAQAPARSVPRVQTIIPVTETGSQDEYDESDSEEDHVLSSSTENTQPSPEENMEDSDGESDGDADTALGQAHQPVFRPQPNAFSHPPSHQRSYSSNATMSPHPHREFTRPSFSQRSNTRVQRGPSFMSPSVREDNDEALRASLTTLLSCAAAVSGLPKSKEETEAQRAAQTRVGPSSQPMELRFVPEKELEEESEKPRAAATPVNKHGQSSPARSSSQTRSSSDRAKRTVPTGRNPRATKKKRTAAVTAVTEETFISPTLLTWVVSAGVVVLVSVVGFGAGYVIGREVGRQEGLAASVNSVNDTASSGREVLRSSGGGLRRFRWGDVGRSIVAQA